jgi:hypothetical protein
MISEASQSADYLPLVIHRISSQIQKNSPKQQFFPSVHACRKGTKYDLLVIEEKLGCLWKAAAVHEADGYADA